VLGGTRSSFVIGEDALRFETNDPLSGGSEVLRRDSIRERHGGNAGHGREGRLVRCQKAVRRKRQEMAEKSRRHACSVADHSRSSEIE